MQFVIDELPSLAVCCAGGIYGGMEGVPYPVAGVAVFFFLSLVLLYRFIYLCRIHYHIGIEQLVCEQGVFVRKVDYMELYRIVDFQEHQSLMQQLCGLKTVRIFSTDRNTPRLDLTGMRRKDDDRNTPRLDLTGMRRKDDIVPLIRGRVEYNKRKKGIYEITNH